MAGQSNMQGHAEIGPFDYIGDDPSAAPLLGKMRGTDGKPHVCDKVWISSVACAGDGFADVFEQTGKLTAGFGASEKKIGPEFTFGITMEEPLQEPVRIIKTAWGGRSLLTDFLKAQLAPALLLESGEMSLPWQPRHSGPLNSSPCRENMNGWNRKSICSSQTTRTDQTKKAQ